MKKLVLIAAMLMASASAHAGSFSFNVEGQKVRVNIPRGCSSLSCINVTAPGLADKFGSKDDTSTTTTATAPAPAPAAAPAPQAVAPAPVAPAPVAQAPVAAPQPSTKVTLLPAPAADTSAPTASAPTISAPAVTVPEASVQPAPAPVAAPAPAPVQVAAAPAAPAAPAPVQAANSPIGMWVSEKDKGKVRIEECGSNLCGYSIDKNGSNGAKVLIDMKPRGDKWDGRLKDPRSGSVYNGNIALRGTDRLRVTGCMMMFCGGETWTRLQ